MDTSIETNKAIVIQFNQDLIEGRNLATADTIFHDEFINHTAGPGFDKGKGGVMKMFNEVLRPALSNIKVTIYDQVAEGDLVTTRKTISGTHTGVLFDVPASSKELVITVIDIVRIRDGQYFEHWGVNTMPVVLQQLRGV
jgi:predicted SnoaL-like aldol condensation-catalyzing enzyme